MKKYIQLFTFTAVLTMLMYTGCGSSDERNSFAPAKMDITADAPADAKGFAGEALDNGEDGAAADGDFYAVPEAAADGDFDAVPEAFMMDDASIIEGAEKALAAVEGEMNADIAPEGEMYIPEPEVTPSVGMLTAGEWKDHDNWGFFSNLVNTGIIAFPSFGLDPTQRIAVTVTDHSGTPLPNAEVILNSDSEMIWKSITDQNGQAYVFEMNGKTGVNLTVTQGDASEMIDIPSASVDEQGNVQTGDRSYTVQLNAEQKLCQQTQIMFIVDTTGSMGDEMLYLQSDFGAIAEEVGDENTVYSVNFYKDEGDEYITNCSGFTADTNAIKEKLNNEFASGGGDEPEAVYEVLKETIFSPDWNEESVKIAFLIYDAPPHEGTEFEAIISEASAKGIHLVPVVSSNGSRETELFGRALAICTNGDYVFLTDDSGIGDSHLEPIIGDYQVEPLHDIIVRIINDYKQ